MGFGKVISQAGSTGVSDLVGSFSYLDLQMYLKVRVH